MRIKQCWNDVDREKPKYEENNLSQCRFVHHKAHTNFLFIIMATFQYSNSIIKYIFDIYFKMYSRRNISIRT